MLLLMMVISFTVLLSTAAFSIATENKKSGVLGQQQLQCYYIAASGLEHALARATTELNTAQDKLYGMSSTSSLTEYALGNVADGSYKVSVEKIGTREYRFKSVGTLGNITKYLEAVIQLNNDMDFARGVWVGGNLINSGDLSGQCITMNSDITVKGYTDISQVLIKGNLHSDSYARLRGVKVNGKVTSATGFVDIDAYNGFGIDRCSVVGHVTAAGDVAVKGTAGDIYSGGAVTIQEDSQRDGSKAGNITCRNGAVISNSTVNSINSEGNITIQSSTAGGILTNGMANIQDSTTGSIKSKLGLTINNTAQNKNQEKINGSLYSAGDIRAAGTTIEQNVLGNSIYLDSSEVKGYVFAKSGVVQKTNGSVVRGVFPPNLSYEYKDRFTYETQNKNVSAKLPSFIKNLAWYSQRTPEDHKILLGPNDSAIEINDDSTDKRYDLSQMSGIYIIESPYLKPKVYVSGRYRGNVVIVVDGDIYVPGELQPEKSSDSMALIANGNVILGNLYDTQNPFTIRALVYANNDMSIYGAIVTGALIVNRDLDISALHTFHYNADLVNLPFFNKAKPPFTVIRKEKYPVMREES
ncbi:hypothetical protein SAMN02745123_00591 [Desulforamulus aeronauticus DSM 10349]|uniref:Polymer-forming protein n=2 Tax=Desulforamulus aeronauticus TaxID=53343 RepID=A0A1M6PHM9_9FIRM|nr:hypothetical protein SAMN02745123_00591 [Desulforamulus aeronauticus DSM 10349]